MSISPAPPPTASPSRKADAAARDARPSNALIRPREDPRGKLIRLIVVLVSFVILVAGWRVVGIDIPKLVVGLPAAQHIALGLVTPDLVRPETVRSEVQAPFVV